MVSPADGVRSSSTRKINPLEKLYPQDTARQKYENPQLQDTTGNLTVLLSHTLIMDTQQN